MIQAKVVTSHPLMHVLIRLALSDIWSLLSLVSKPAKLFSEMNYRVFRQKMPLFAEA